MERPAEGSALRRWAGNGARAVFVVLVIATGGHLLLLGRVPFVEGDWTIRAGDGYGFRIGMSKAEALAALRERYGGPGCELRVRIRSRAAARRQGLEVQSVSWRHGSRGGEWRSPVSGIGELAPPLLAADSWLVELPGWVNMISLTFEDERLTAIRRSRWLYERW